MEQLDAVFGGATQESDRAGNSSDQAGSDRLRRARLRNLVADS